MPTIRQIFYRNGRLYVGILPKKNQKKTGASAMSIWHGYNDIPRFESKKCLPKWKELPNSTASEIETDIPTEYRIRNEIVPPRMSRNWNKAMFPLLDRIWNKSIFTKMTSSESWLVITLMTPHFATASWAPEPNQICKDLCPPSFQNGSLVPNGAQSPQPEQLRTLWQKKKQAGWWNKCRLTDGRILQTASRTI